MLERTLPMNIRHEFHISYHQRHHQKEQQSMAHVYIQIYLQKGIVNRACLEDNATRNRSKYSSLGIDSHCVQLTISLDFQNH